MECSSSEATREMPGPNPKRERIRAGVSSSSPPHIRNPEFAAEVTKLGLKFFKEGNFTVASVRFKEALDIMVESFGKMDLRCASAYYKYGLTLLYKVPIPDDDPMRVVPKEADYLLDLGGGSIFHSAARQTGNLNHDEKVNWRDDYEKLGAARKELNVAWLIVKDEEPDNTMEKVNIMSAMGEVAFRQGELECYYLYTHALEMLEQLVEPDNQRIAHLNFKLCLWMEDSCTASDAFRYCQKAISVAEKRLNWLLARLLAEVKSAAEAVATLSASLDLNQLPPEESTNSLSILQKKAEARTLVLLCSDFQSKLDELKALITNSINFTSEKLGTVASMEETPTFTSPGRGTSSAKRGRTSRQLSRVLDSNPSNPTTGKRKAS